MMRGPIEILSALRLPAVTGVLQVGASVGQELEYFAAHGISHGAFLEPLEEPFALLAQRCAALGHYLPINILCGPRDGDVVPFYVATNNGESSSLLPPLGHLHQYPFITFPQQRTLTTFALDTVFTAVAQSHPEIASAINLLYMDVQGAELKVLLGAGRLLQRVPYIYTEVGFGGGYEGDVPLEDLIAFLKGYGFRLYEVEMNAEGWGNALFARRDISPSGRS